MIVRADGATGTDKTESHLADSKELESVVAFIECLSKEKLSQEEIEELRQTIDGSQKS